MNTDNGWFGFGNIYNMVHSFHLMGSGVHDLYFYVKKTAERFYMTKDELNDF